MSEAKIASSYTGTETSSTPILYVLDTNVLIHDPTSILNFDEHHVVIPITVLEELDSLKSGRQSNAADCRQAIRELDRVLSGASPEEVEAGVVIKQNTSMTGRLSILMTKKPDNLVILSSKSNDNKILNDVGYLKQANPGMKIVLVTKDINVRLKARACGIDSQDYHSDQLLNDIEQLNKGYLKFKGSFWSNVGDIETEQTQRKTLHKLPPVSYTHLTLPTNREV